MNRLRSALFVATLALPVLARAEADDLLLGNGHHGPFSVTTANVSVNPHTPVSAAIPAGSWTANVVRTSGFQPGDVVLIVQSTGLADRASGDQAAISLDAVNVGRYELVRLATVSVGRLGFASAIQGNYDLTGTQVVLVPEYTTVTISAAGRLVAPAWDGASGGIVAFLATGAVSNDGVISANGAGFRGGVRTVDWYVPPVNCPALDEASPRAERKGEGLVPARFTATSTGRGNSTSGGGGANCINAGGGGGDLGRGPHRGAGRACGGFRR